MRVFLLALLMTGCTTSYQFNAGDHVSFTEGSFFRGCTGMVSEPVICYSFEIGPCYYVVKLTCRNNTTLVLVRANESELVKEAQ